MFFGHMLVLKFKVTSGLWQEDVSEFYKENISELYWKGADCSIELEMLRCFSSIIYIPMVLLKCF